MVNDGLESKKFFKSKKFCIISNMKNGYKKKEVLKYLDLVCFEIIEPFECNKHYKIKMDSMLFIIN